MTARAKSPSLPPGNRPAMAAMFRAGTKFQSTIRRTLMPFLAAKDATQLYWRDRGEGPRRCCSSTQSRLRQRRGHGRSDQPARDYDHDTFADDVATLIDQLGCSGLTLITHLLAAGEAVRYLTPMEAPAWRASSCWRRRRRCC